MKILNIPIIILLLLTGCSKTVDVTKNDIQVPPEPVYQPAPLYPDVLRREGKTGTVTVEFTIRSDGTTAQIKVIESPHKLFSLASIEAVKQWKFKPGTVNGKPVASRVRMPLPFKIRYPEKSK